jgi:ferredoxin--NADP+ reductase
VSTIGSTDEPLRVAVIGSGPAGFYTAGHLLKCKAMPDLVAQVDLFDRLPTPWGLVRAGVAPDHPNIKAVSRVYEKTAALSGFRFFGGVELGRHVHRGDLLRHYHAVVYAVGSQADRRLGIPGEELDGSWAATEFVAWYNGHPDYRELEFSLSTRRAVVIGNGNVALDVARMLALAPEELERTDVADRALEALRHSEVEEIVLVGRRGPLQAAFTNPELRELGELADADVIVDPAELELDRHSEQALETADVTRKRNLEVLREYAARRPAGKRKRVVLRFLASPVELLGGSSVSSIELVRNELTADGKARPTGQRESIETGLVFRSIGYRATPLPELPFDEVSATIPNDRGRVLDSATGEPLPGEYAVGWVKRGPTGVIGTNKRDADETVQALLDDLQAGRLARPRDPDPDAVGQLVEDHVDYEDWLRIDAAERAAGEPQQRPRVKLCSADELIAAARGVEISTG